MLCTASSLSSCTSLHAKQIARGGSCWMGSVPTSSTSSGAGHWEWCWTLGLIPSSIIAVARAVDLLLTLWLAAVSHPWISRAALSSVCLVMPLRQGSSLPCPVLVQLFLHESNSGTTIINIIPSKNMSYLFSKGIYRSPLQSLEILPLISVSFMLSFLLWRKRTT